MRRDAATVSVPSPFSHPRRPHLAEGRGRAVVLLLAAGDVVAWRGGWGKTGRGRAQRQRLAKGWRQLRWASRAGQRCQGAAAGRQQACAARGEEVRAPGMLAPPSSTNATGAGEGEGDGEGDGDGDGEEDGEGDGEGDASGEGDGDGDGEGDGKGDGEGDALGDGDGNGEGDGDGDGDGDGEGEGFGMSETSPGSSASVDSSAAQCEPPRDSAASRPAQPPRASASRSAARTSSARQRAEDQTRSTMPERPLGGGKGMLKHVGGGQLSGGSSLSRARQRGGCPVARRRGLMDAGGAWVQPPRRRSTLQLTGSRRRGSRRTRPRRSATPRAPRRRRRSRRRACGTG
jgi:hypothetical protein